MLPLGLLLLLLLLFALLSRSAIVAASLAASYLLCISFPPSVAAIAAAAASHDAVAAADVAAAILVGQNASHGTESKAHRSHGSIGQSKTVNVVWKFKKMAGHVGPDPRVVNCQVMRIQADRNLIFLKGERDRARETKREQET